MCSSYTLLKPQNRVKYKAIEKSSYKSILKNIGTWHNMYGIYLCAYLLILPNPLPATAFTATKSSAK